MDVALFRQTIEQPKQYILPAGVGRIAICRLLIAGGVVSSTASDYYCHVMPHFDRKRPNGTSSETGVMEVFVPKEQKERVGHFNSIGGR